MKPRDRLVRAYRDNGATGVAARALRHALSRTASAVESAERRVLWGEFERRISDERRQLLLRNRDLRGIHAGERAFVIGNGPSLKGQDLAPLGDERTFAVNAFYRHPILDVWHPTYYAVTDGQLFVDDAGAAAFFDELRPLTSTFFAPIEYVDVIDELGYLPSNTHYLAQNGFLASTPLREVDLTRVIPSANTVVQTAIMIAIYMGFREIVLLGCDHNWLDDPQSAGHFYRGKTAEHLADNQENALLSDYYALLTYVRNMWRGYRHLQAVTERAGVRIVNATDGGRLDVFERVPLEVVLHR